MPPGCLTTTDVLGDGIGDPLDIENLGEGIGDLATAAAGAAATTVCTGAVAAGFATAGTGWVTC